MRAISLSQPHASLISISAKKVETRSWPTRFHGPIAIHASKGFPGWARDICGEPLFRAALFKGGFRGWANLPLGEIVAVADLIKCRSTNAWANGPGIADWVKQLSREERAFGNYGPARFGLFLDNIRRLPKPIPCKGALGLWTVPEDIAQLVAEQIGKVTGQLAAMEASNGG